MRPQLRRFHRVASLCLLIPLLLTLATGMTYRLGRAWFGMSKDSANQILEFHAGDWLGDWGSALYVLLVGLGLLALLLTGAVLMFRNRSRGVRGFHRILGAILLLPLTISAATGVLFKLGGDWFGFSKPTLGVLMSLHQGTWLGPTVRPFYILFIGAGLLVLAIAGLRIAWMSRAARTRPSAA